MIWSGSRSRSGSYFFSQFRILIFKPQLKNLQILSVHFETAARLLKHFADFLIIFYCVKTYLTILKKKWHKTIQIFLSKKVRSRSVSIPLVWIQIRSGQKNPDLTMSGSTQHYPCNYPAQSLIGSNVNDIGTKAQTFRYQSLLS